MLVREIFFEYFFRVPIFMAAHTSIGYGCALQLIRAYRSIVSQHSHRIHLQLIKKSFFGGNPLKHWEDILTMLAPPFLVRKAIKFDFYLRRQKLFNVWGLHWDYGHVFVCSGFGVYKGGLSIGHLHTDPQTHDTHWKRNRDPNVEFLWRALLLEFLNLLPRMVVGVVFYGFSVSMHASSALCAYLSITLAACTGWIAG